jgi:hypothetical protein
MYNGYLDKHERKVYSLYSIKILTTELSAKIQDWLVWRNLYDFKNVEDDSPII